MVDYLSILAETAKRTVKEGYYRIATPVRHRHLGLKEALRNCKGKNAVIAELKFASPSRGEIAPVSDPVRIAKAMERGGATGISVLTEPKHFQGSLKAFTTVREEINLPLLFKDIVISPTQLQAASAAGADAVLLISSIFRKGLTSEGLDDMIDIAHSLGLEVLLETHGEDELSASLSSRADMVGINSRNLETMKLDLKGTARLLKRFRNPEKVIVVESGIESDKDVSMLKMSGAKAFLVGTSIMSSSNPEKKVKELVHAV